MKHWLQRPIEVRNLFNPAFCGLVLHRAVTAYQERDSRGMAFSMSLLVLPLSSHRQSREIIHEGNRGFLLKTIAGHPELQVGFAERCTDVLPFTLEALGLLSSMGALRVQDGGRLVALGEGVKKTVSGTEESKATQRVAAYIGKQFAAIGDSRTIYITFGIRP